MSKESSEGGWIWLGDSEKTKERALTYQCAQEASVGRFYVGETITYVKRDENGRAVKGTSFGELVQFFEEARTGEKFAVITHFFTIKDVQNIHAPALGKLEGQIDNKEVFYQSSKEKIPVLDILEHFPLSIYYAGEKVVKTAPPSASSSAQSNWRYARYRFSYNAAIDVGYFQPLMKDQMASRSAAYWSRRQYIAKWMKTAKRNQTWLLDPISVGSEPIGSHCSSIGASMGSGDFEQSSSDNKQRPTTGGLSSSSSSSSSAIKGGASNKNNLGSIAAAGDISMMQECPKCGALAESYSHRSSFSRHVLSCSSEPATAEKSVQMNKGVASSSKGTPPAASVKLESNDSDSDNGDDERDDERELESCPICGVCEDKYTQRTSFVRHVQKANCAPSVTVSREFEQDSKRSSKAHKQPSAVPAASTSSVVAQSRKKGDDSSVKSNDKSSDATKLKSCPNCGVTQNDFVYPHSFRKHLGRCAGGDAAVETTVVLKPEKRGLASSQKSAAASSSASSLSARSGSGSSKLIVAESSKTIGKVKKGGSKEPPSESESGALPPVCPCCGSKAEDFAASSSFVRHMKRCIARGGIGANSNKPKACGKCGVPKERYAHSSSYYKHVTNCTGMPWIEPGSNEDPLLEAFGGPVQDNCPECNVSVSSYSLWNSFLKHVKRCTGRAAHYRELIRLNQLDEIPSDFLEREAARQSLADSASTDVGSSRPGKRAKTKGDSSSSASSASLPSSSSSFGREDSSKSRGKASEKEISAAKRGDKLRGKERQISQRRSTEELDLDNLDGGNYRPARVRNDKFDPFGAPRGTVHAGGGYRDRKTEPVPSADFSSGSESEIETKAKGAITKRKRKDVEEEIPIVMKADESEADPADVRELISCPMCNVAAALFSFNSSFVRHVSTCKGVSGAPSGNRLGSGKSLRRAAPAALRKEASSTGKKSAAQKSKVQDPSSESDDSSLEGDRDSDDITEELYGTNGRPLRARNSFNPFGAPRGTVHAGGGLSAGAARQISEELHSSKPDPQRASQSAPALVSKAKMLGKSEKGKANPFVSSHLGVDGAQDATSKKNLKSCPKCNIPVDRFQHLHSFHRHLNNCMHTIEHQLIDGSSGSGIPAVALTGFGRVGKVKKLGSLVSSRALSKVAARQRLAGHPKSTDADAIGSKMPGKRKLKEAEIEADRQSLESDEVEEASASSKRSSRVDASATEFMQLDLAQPTYFKRARKEENESEPRGQIHALLPGEKDVPRGARLKGSTSKKQPSLQKQQQDLAPESLPESGAIVHGISSRSSRSASESGSSDSELSTSSIVSVPDPMRSEKGGKARPQTYMQMISPHLKAASDSGQKADATKVFDEEKKCVDFTRLDISACIPAFQRDAEEFRLAREKELENRIWCPGLSDDEEEAKDLQSGLRASMVSKDEERLLCAHAANLYLPPVAMPKAQRDKLMKSKAVQALGEQQFLVRLARFARAGKQFKTMSNEEIRREMRVRAAHIKVGGGSIHAAALAVIQEVESWPADGFDAQAALAASSTSIAPSVSRGALDLGEADVGKGIGAETSSDPSPPHNFMPATYTPSAVPIIPPTLRYDRGTIPYFLSCAYDEIGKAMYRSLVGSATAYIARIRKAEKTRLDGLREKLKTAGSRRIVENLGPTDLYNPSQLKRYSNPGYMDLLNIKDDQIVPVVDGTFMFHKPGVPANLLKILNASGGNVQQAMDVLRMHLSTSNAGDGELCEIVDSNDEDEDEGSLSQSSNDEGDDSNPRIKSRPRKQVRVPKASSGGNMTVESYITAWSIWEQTRFQSSYARYGPDFSRIGRAVPTKSRVELIDYYFRFVEAAQELQKCDLKAKDYNTLQHGGDLPATLIVEESDSALEKEMDIDNDVSDIEEISAIRETIDKVSEVVRTSGRNSSSSYSSNSISNNSSSSSSSSGIGIGGSGSSSSTAASGKCKREGMFNPESKTDALRIDSVKFLIRAKEELTDVAFALLLNNFKAFAQLNHDNPAQMIVRARNILGHGTLSSQNRTLGVASGVESGTGSGSGSGLGGSTFPLQCSYSDSMPLEPSSLNMTYGFNPASAAYADVRNLHNSVSSASTTPAAAMAIPQGNYSSDGDAEELEDVARPTRVRKMSSKVEESMLLNQSAMSKSEASYTVTHAAKSNLGNSGHYAGAAWSTSKADKLKSAEEQAVFAARSCSEPKTPNSGNPFTLRGSTYCKIDDKYQLDRKYHHLSKGASADAAKLGRTTGHDYGLVEPTAAAAPGVPFAKSLFAEFLGMLPAYIADQAGKNRA